MSYPQRNLPNDGNPISTRDIERLAVIAAREAGIELGQDKADFLLSRLSRHLDQDGLASFSQYCDVLERPGATAQIRRFVEAITTHTTSFFRERGHFDWLWSHGFRELWSKGAGRSRDLVIWSAACSTGQELFSAMICAQHAATRDFQGMRFRGIGTDISSKVVAQAQSGIYSQPDIIGVPAELRAQSLLSSKAGDGRYRIVPDLRQRTNWRLANLTRVNTLTNIDADIVFLRNVLIYFDDDTQISVIRNVLSRLRPGGFLLTGHSETAHARTLDLTVIKPTIYRKER